MPPAQALTTGGVGANPFGADEARVRHALATIGEPDSSYAPTTSGDTCRSVLHSGADWGNFGVIFVDGKLAAWWLTETGSRRAVPAISSSIGIHLGDHRPDLAAIEARTDATTEAPILGMVFARTGSSTIWVNLDADGVVNSITAVAVGLGECVAAD